MKNKGFTLIELLAVIVILAIIALIATPIIIGIINDARAEAKIRSAEAVIHAVETSYLTQVMKVEANGGTVTVANVVTGARVDNATVSGSVITTKDGAQCTVSEWAVSCVDKDNTSTVLKTKTLSTN